MQNITIGTCRGARQGCGKLPTPTIVPMTGLHCGAGAVDRLPLLARLPVRRPICPPTRLHNQNNQEKKPIQQPTWLLSWTQQEKRDGREREREEERARSARASERERKEDILGEGGSESEADIVVAIVAVLVIVVFVVVVVAREEIVRRERERKNGSGDWKEGGARATKYTYHQSGTANTINTVKIAISAKKNECWDSEILVAEGAKERGSNLAAGGQEQKGEIAGECW